jgi:hypothetical protein
VSDVAHSTKVTGELVSRIETSDADGLVDVVVELAPLEEPAVETRDRQAAIQARKDGFRVAAEPIVETIRSCGGEVTGEAWINQTLRARVPASAIALIAAEDTVAVVDVPHTIEPESA